MAAVESDSRYRSCDGPESRAIGLVSRLVEDDEVLGAAHDLAWRRARPARPADVLPGGAP